MAIINLKDIRTHRYCPKTREHSHRCYDKEEAESLRNARSIESTGPLWGSWQCFQGCKGKCWHVGHLRQSSVNTYRNVGRYLDWSMADIKTMDYGEDV